MKRARHRLDLAPRKRPSQRRSRETFEALVTACTGLLPELGYAGTTTNHVARRAGVNVASLYEYFPGKDAIVAEVAGRLVERVMGRLAEGLPRVMAARRDEAIRRWIELIHDTVAREKGLVSVFLYQVPYTNQLPPIQDVGERLLAFSRQVRARAGGFVRADFDEASMHLVINLVTSTILQSLLDPPRDVSRRALLDTLVAWVDERIRG